MLVKKFSRIYIKGYQDMKYTHKFEETRIIGTTYPFINEEYNQERYAWYDLEDDCDDWYMDSCHFWDDNYFHLLFDDSTPPYVENIMEGSQELVMTTNFQLAYSLVVVCYVDLCGFFGYGWIYIFGST
jgi:hypothetical protein